MEMDRGKKIAANIFIFSVVMLIVLTFMYFKSPGKEITGRVVLRENVDDIESEDKISCTDSDGGRNYFIKGRIDYCNGDCLNEEDSCSGKRLIEWYCENNEKNYEEYLCEDECEEGVCANLVGKYKYVYTGGGGGGGGTSSSGGTVSTPSQIRDLGKLTSEYQLELANGEGTRFSISGIDYTLTLDDYAVTQATMTLNGQIVILLISEDKEIDLNGDGISDVYLKVKSANIINRKVGIILRLIS